MKMLDFWIGVAYTSTVFLLLSWFIFWPVTKTRIHNRAIEVGAAHYDAVTGDFTWSNGEVKYVCTGEK